MMKLSTVNEWLTKVYSVHPTEIALGLERINVIAKRLQLLPCSFPVITVGGTNGKGSTVAALESIYLAGGYRVGVFTSPYLFKVNEQIHINGNEVQDEDLCEAFSNIFSVLHDITLTPFEIITLVALLIFKQHALDIVILEVGLGGRLDAVNIVHANVAIVTTIGIDHTQYLGNTIEAIAFEKAGIFRTQRPAVYGDYPPPSSLVNRAKELKTPLFVQTKDFIYEEKDRTWDWQSAERSFLDLPKNTLLIQNMSTALMALTLLSPSLPLGDKAIVQGLTTAKLLGRIQVVEGSITRIYDVAHNPQAVTLLANYLKDHPIAGKTKGVFSMLQDKDRMVCINSMKSYLDEWFVAPLNTPRAATLEQLKQSFDDAHVERVHYFSNISDAYQAAQLASQDGDRVVVFGSFHTVAEAMA